MKIRNVILFSFVIVLIFSGFNAESQVIRTGEDSTKVLYRYEWSLYGLATSEGYGLGYRHGRHLTGYKKLMYELEFVLMKDPKEYKIQSDDPSSKSFMYGKLNYLFILRPGLGIQNVINSKPYWGGVEIRYFYYGGLSLGFTKPVYLYVYDPYSQDGGPVVERYDPHNPLQNSSTIIGSAPFTYGLDKIGFHPGIYGKFGFNFEFGTETTKIRCFEVGTTLDFYPTPIALMALNPKDRYFLTAYLSYSFGRRLNKE